MINHWGDIFIWYGVKYQIHNMSDKFDLDRDVTIQNIVGSGELPMEIDTEEIGRDLSGKHYEDKPEDVYDKADEIENLDEFSESLRGVAEGKDDSWETDSHTWMDEGPQPGLYYEIDGNEGPQVTFHESGSYIVRADSEKELHETNRMVIKQLKDMGAVQDDLDMKELDFNVQNVVALAMLNEDIKLRALSMALQGEKGDAQYEPEVFPALEYSNEDYPCSFLVYGNGKIIIAGSSSVDEVYKSMEDFYDRIEGVYFNVTRR